LTSRIAKVYKSGKWEKSIMLLAGEPKRRGKRKGGGTKKSMTDLHRSIPAESL
jgi:hypothetical protein